MSLLLLLKPPPSSAGPPPPAPTDTLYLRDLQAGNATLPANFLGAWEFKSASNRGATARQLAAASGGDGAGNAWGVSFLLLGDLGAEHTAACGQFLSPPLAAQEIGAGDWTLALARGLDVTNGDITHRSRFGLYLVNGATGAIRTTIIAAAIIGGITSASAGVVRSSYSTTRTGSAATASAGDYLALESGLSVFNDLDDATIEARSWGDGDNAIASDNAVVTDPQARIVAPAVLTFA